MMARITALGLFAGVLTGCATGPKYEEVRCGFPTLAAEQGRIYFFRSSNPFGSAIQPSVMLSGEKVGDSRPGGFFFVDRTPGNYEVNLTTEVDKTTDGCKGQGSFWGRTAASPGFDCPQWSDVYVSKGSEAAGDDRPLPGSGDSLTAFRR